MRARNIKPGLFKNELLGTADPLCTVVFCGLWCLADREGRLEDRPLRVHVEINPYRHPESTVQALDWLVLNGFVIRYTNEQGNFLQIVNFSRHQQPHKKEAPSKIEPPTPQQVDRAPGKHGASTGQAALIPDTGYLIPDTGYRIPEKQAAAKSKPKAEAQPFDASAIDGLDVAVWQRWTRFRRELGHPIKRASAEAAAKALAAFGAQQAAVVEQSIANGWRGLFALKAAPAKHANLTQHNFDAYRTDDDAIP